MNKIKVTLNPIEQRYIATCYPLKDRPYYEEALRAREIFRDYAIKNETIEIDLNNIALAFPHLARLIREGFFKERTIQSYFEGIDDKSHNMRNYLFAKSRMRDKLPENVLFDILHHVEYCSVRPCYLKENIIFSYGGEVKDDIDKYYFSLSIGQESFQVENREYEFAFLHGRSEKGSIFVRYVSKEEFENLLKWFEERWKSKENPFRIIKNYSYKTH
ncbi:MAG: hypothetical protein QW758_01850 [Candidatus Aenigmatarchaeota archaeon]